MCVYVCVCVRVCVQHWLLLLLPPLRALTAQHAARLGMEEEEKGGEGAQHPVCTRC